MSQVLKIAFLTFSKILHLIPMRLLWVGGDLLGLLWFDVFRIRRTVALDNLRIAYPEWSEAQRIRVARQSLKGMGRTIIEILTLPSFTVEEREKYFVILGKEHFEKAASQGKGVLLLTLHIGNGDFGFLALGLFGYRMHMISKQFKNKRLNDFWFGLRRKQGMEFIREEKSSFEILKTLRAKGSVIFVLDQFMGPPVGVRTKFFGKETGTAAGLALFAERTEAPVVPICTYRLDDGRAVVEFKSAIPFEDQGNRDQNISYMTQKYTDQLERMVRERPEQWMWIHRRWKEFRE